jgi:hypothetical protein
MHHGMSRSRKIEDALVGQGNLLATDDAERGLAPTGLTM